MEKWRNLKFDTKIILIAFVAMGVLSLLFGFTAKPKEENTQATEIPAAPSVDTFIPMGYTLVPLELANAESLTSLVGDMGGVVDLYLATNDRQKGGLKVGSKLKLLRAPRDPNQYAVLVKDSESPRLMSFTGPFIAVVQNPKAKGAELSAEAKKSKFKVDYQN